MSARREFVVLASAEGVNMAALCRRFGVSRKTGYKWRARYQAEGEAGLVDQSRRPQTQPATTPEVIEQQVLAIRAAHPAWGGRKIRKRLQVLAAPQVPAASTITAILHRHGCIAAEATAARTPYQRFERSAPNELWQIDFKGKFKMNNGRDCHPLTVLDDHSRYAVGLVACDNQRRETVKGHLIALFRRYGMPQALYCDNGAPWGSAHAATRHTRLTAWLMRLGIEVLHGRPYHPQGRGKEERFHRTLKAELLQDQGFDDLASTQRRFDPWREMYNHERPHETLGLEVPASRYRASVREYPEQLRPFEYSSRFEVRKTNRAGRFSFQGRSFQASEAFAASQLGLSPTAQEGVWEVYYCRSRLGWLDLRSDEATLRRGAAGGPSVSARCARSNRQPPGEEEQG